MSRCQLHFANKKYSNKIRKVGSKKEAAFLCTGFLQLCPVWLPEWQEMAVETAVLKFSYY